MSMLSGIDIGTYNDFCHSITEGSILYNIDATNLWGDYLLVVNKAVIHVNEIKTYSLLLLGLRKDGNQYVPRNLRISVTPDYAGRIPFLKQVGVCKYKLLPVLKDVDINTGLVAVYSSTDLHKYTKKLNIRKPKKKKYDKEGKPTIKKFND